MRVLAGAVGTPLAVGSLSFELELAHDMHVSLVPAALMIVALLGGWTVAAASAVVVSVAALFLHGDPWQISLIAAVAVLCAEMLRRGTPPLLVAGVQLTPALLFLLLPLPGSDLAPAAFKTLGSAAANAAVNVALATTALILMPRRSLHLPSRCRVRWNHIVFALVVGTVSVAAITLLAWTNHPWQALSENGTWGEATAARLRLLLLVAFAASFALASRFEAVTHRLPDRLRTPREHKLPRGMRPRGELPLEVAGFFLDVTRKTNRLRRDAARHCKDLTIAHQAAQCLRGELRKNEDVLNQRTAQLGKTLRALESARARYQALMAQSPDVTIFADHDGIIQCVSRSVVSMLGFQPVELKCKPVSVLIPEDCVMDHALNLTAREGGTQAAAGVVETAVRTASGKHRKVAACVHPFTVRRTKNYAIQLREVGCMMRALAPLEPAKTLTGSAHRWRDVYVATVSHELRTPLHDLIATLDMLHDGEYGSAEFRQWLSIARTSARMLLTIANDILDLTRIDSGHFPLELRPFCLRNILEEIVDEFRARAESAGLSVATQPPPMLPPAFLGDSARLKQILGNLVSNALRFTSNGGVTLGVQYDGTRCIIDVTDTGEGIPHDMRESIFDPFVQVESASARRGGAGLGLPISRRLAEAMGGTLTLLRTDPTGSTFRLTLPLAASDQAPPDEQNQRIFDHPRGGRILVVEDNQANRCVAEALLASLECPATSVESGAEALDLLAKQEFDLILMDCQMPGLDGYETTRRARRLPGRRIPIIAVTANAMAEDRNRCLEAGMDDFLPKPFGRRALNDMLCKWLDPANAARAGKDLAAILASLPALDVSVFDDLRDSLQRRREPLQRICTMFVRSAEMIFPLLDGSAGIDRGALPKHLHTLLGSAGMVGACQVEYLAGKLKSVVESNQQEEVPAVTDLLRQALPRFAREFEARLAAVTPEDTQASDREQ